MEGLQDNGQQYGELNTRLDSLPKLPENDSRVQAMLSGEAGYGHEQFGNNFYMVFTGFAKYGFYPEELPEDDVVWEIYSGRLAAEPAFDLIAQEESVKRIVDYFRSEEWLNHRSFSAAYLNALRIAGSSEDREAAFSELEAACDEVSLFRENEFIWEKVNEMLREVAEKLRSLNVDPQAYFG